MTRHKAAERRGRRAEWLAAWALRLKGWRILARGHVTGRGTGAGEVDIVARRGGLLAFVEVKARPSLDQAAEAVSPAQRRRIERGAAAFLAARPDLAVLRTRFDLMLVIPGRWPVHRMDAWRVGD